MSPLLQLFTEAPALFGGQIALIVMTVVFLILAIIFLAITLTGAFFRGKSKKSAKTPDPAPAKPQVSAAAAAADAQSDEELLAVLTAAVAAYRGKETESGAFRVVSFRRR